MMVLRKQLLAASALLLGACAGARVQSGPPLGPVAIEQRLFRDNAGGIRNVEERVIKDSTAWRDVWRLVTATQATVPPVPTVDFRQDMLLVVAAGRMTIADAIRVDSVGNRAETNQAGKRVGIVAVYYTITRDCPSSTREAYPVEIVRVRKSESTVRFFTKSEQGPGCR
jgi:hypothetical protein